MNAPVTSRFREVQTMMQAFEFARADYDAMRPSRFRRKRVGLALAGSGADYHYKNEASYLRLMEMARDMDRNDVVVGQMINRAVTNTIQDGIKLKANTGDDVLNSELEARWEEWADDPDLCDVAGESAFTDFEWLALRAQFVDGDSVALPLEDGRMQLIEAHRIRTPLDQPKNVVNGVHLAPDRERLAYWFTKDDINPRMSAVRTSEMTRRTVRDAAGNRQLMHIVNPRRITQTRGVTALAPIFDIAAMFDDINFAKVVQAQVCSCFAIFRQMSAGGSLPGVGTPQSGERTTENLADGSLRTIEGISPGMEVIGMPGEELKGFSPNIPNPEYFPHAKLLLTLIGINVGLPLILVTMDSSETNFSGWRGSIDQARLGFRHNQKLLIRRFHRPTYLWKLRDWASTDSSLARFQNKADVHFSRHTWTPPSWQYIEPKKDAEADILRLDNHLTSHTSIFAERSGTDFNTEGARIMQDRAKLIRWAHEEADALNKKHPGMKVTWRDVYSLKQKPTKPSAQVQPVSPGADDDDPDD